MFLRFSLLENGTEGYKYDSNFECGLLLKEHQGPKEMKMINIKNTGQFVESPKKTEKIENSN